jgi:hypothetical protein
MEGEFFITKNESTLVSNESKITFVIAKPNKTAQKAIEKMRL